MSTETDLIPRFELQITICKGNISAGNIPTSIQVMTTINGHIVHTTEGKPWPAIWNDYVAHNFHTLQPVTPILISFSLYRKRFTTKSWKLIGSVHFSLQDFVQNVNRGPIQQDYQVILNQKNLMTFSGSIQLKFEVIDRWEMAAVGSIPDAIATALTGSTGENGEYVDPTNTITTQDDADEDGTTASSTKQRPWKRRVSMLVSNTLFRQSSSQLKSSSSSSQLLSQETDPTHSSTHSMTQTCNEINASSFIDNDSGQISKPVIAPLSPRSLLSFPTNFNIGANDEVGNKKLPSTSSPWIDIYSSFVRFHSWEILFIIVAAGSIVLYGTTWWQIRHIEDSFHRIETGLQRLLQPSRSS